MPTPAPLSLSELRVPDSHKMASVMDALTDAGRADFLSELYGAIEDAAASNSSAPVQFVVNAWWVSGKFIAHPQFDAAVEAAGKALHTDERYDAAGLEALLTPA